MELEKQNTQLESETCSQIEERFRRGGETFEISIHSFGWSYVDEWIMRGECNVKFLRTLEDFYKEWPDLMKSLATCGRYERSWESRGGKSSVTVRLKR